MKNKNYYQKRAKEVIGQIKYLTLATVSEDGIPWNSPVAYSVDENFNFYFGSPRNTQHSQNIRNNRKGFVVIYDSKAPGGEGEGVYMIVDIEELDISEEIAKAMKIMFTENIDINNFMREGKLRLYKISPKKVWMNDAEEKDRLFFDYRVEIELDK